MKALVLFDTFFGNTEKIAAAIGKALASKGDVSVTRVAKAGANEWRGKDVLVVGSPTRAFASTPAIRKYLNGIPRHGLEGVKVAAFDTRMVIEEVNVPILKFLAKHLGYAAGPLEKQLLRKGGTLGVKAEGFFVKGSEGPLKAKELERAAAWARKILAK
jgi:flavodoxin I